jgi:uncharacterized membrane protein YeaQ/YmgE (transglycosylase-associated protein family)
MITIIGWIVSGWIAGSAAEWLVPPATPQPRWQTIATGIGGSVVGGIIYGVLTGSSYQPAGIMYSIIGAICCVFAYRWYTDHGGIE